MTVVVCTPDLADRSRIAAVHPAAVFVGAAAALQARVEPGDLVIVDLARPGVAGVLDEVLAVAGAVVAYGPHVETELLAGAAAAGARVLPRSRFFADVAAATVHS